MMEAATTPHASMLEAIGRLRTLGYRVGALTNNFQVPEGDASLAAVVSGSAASQVLRPLFDDFVESSVVGMRKPDPRIFQLALERLGVAAHETAFLDDLGVNVKAARQLGMHTIRVGLHRATEALWELERLLGVALLAERPPPSRASL
jgi:epoxide hydrolase-like predicted phosphatase